MKQTINTLKCIQQAWRQALQPGDHCIDATAGRGHDTIALARLVGTTGTVTAFDIQPEALASTEALLGEHGLSKQVRLILDSHAHMAQYAAADSLALIAFNLGYLPGGDHSLATRPEETIAAIQAGLELLRPGGLLTLCIYQGGDTGFAERDAVLRYLQNLDYQQYTVLVTDFYNRPNYPPLAVFVYKAI